MSTDTLIVPLISASISDIIAINCVGSSILASISVSIDSNLEKSPFQIASTSSEMTCSPGIDSAKLRSVRSTSMVTAPEVCAVAFV